MNTNVTNYNMEGCEKSLSHPSWPSIATKYCSIYGDKTIITDQCDHINLLVILLISLQTMIYHTWYRIQITLIYLRLSDKHSVRVVLLMFGHQGA